MLPASKVGAWRTRQIHRDAMFMATRNGVKANPFVLILGGDTRYNRGDRAIRSAIVDLLRTWNPSVQIGIVSRTPDRDRGEWGVEVLARSIPKLLRRRDLLKRLDLVWWGGGQLLQDDSSMVKNPYWALVLRALRLRVRCPLIGGGLGVGPVTTAWGRFFAKRAVAQLDACAVRDVTSAQLVQEWTEGHLPVRVLPDPAIILRPSELGAARSLLEQQGVPLKDEELRIGIGLRRWFHIRRRLVPLEWSPRLTTGRGMHIPPLFEQFLANLAAALNQLGAGQARRVLFFPMCDAPWESDEVVSRALASRLEAPSHILALNVPPPLIKAMMGCCHLFVGVRMHSAILALGMNVPTLGIAYVRKGHDVFGQAGLRDQVLDISDAAGPDGGQRLFTKLKQLYQQRAQVQATQTKGWASLESDGDSGYADFIQQAMRHKNPDSI